MSHMISKLWFALALIGADPEQSGACFEKFRPLVGEKMMIFSPTSWGTSPEQLSPKLSVSLPDSQLVGK